MAYEEAEARRILRARIWRQSNAPGTVRSGDSSAPGNRSPAPIRDITGFAYLGFFNFGADGGPNFNPDGELP